MLDLQKLNYHTYLTTEDGARYELTGAGDAVGWEEGEGELALRLSASVLNVDAGGMSLAERAKLGCLLSVEAEWGEGPVAVARARIEDWARSQSASGDRLELSGYDELYSLQKSQDNRYIAAGTGTRAAVAALFGDWGVPLGEYKGPDLPHAKTVYQNEAVSDILLDLLENARKQGGPDCVVRAVDGTVCVLPKGANETVWHFEEDTLEDLQLSTSISGLVTRVKVVGTEDKEGRRSVEALLNGKTAFGIRQKIVTRSKNDSLAAAQAEARAILDEEGAPKERLSVSGADVPTIRKGDRVHFTTGMLSGYYLVTSIRHDAGARTMDMELKPIAGEQAAADGEVKGTSDGGAFQKGDRIVLNGPVFRDSYGGGQGKTFSGYHSTITIRVDTARPCPYHIGSVGWARPTDLTKE